MDKTLVKNTKIIKVVFLLLCCALIFQLFKIQVIQGSAKLKERSSEKNVLKKTTIGSRGRIYFADGTPLAVNELVYGIYSLTDGFDLKQAKEAGIDRVKFLEGINEIIPIDRVNVLKAISDPKRKYVPVASQVSREVYEKIAEKFPSTLNIWTSEEESKRVYPNKQLASKLTGFVKEDDDNNIVGQYGIEQYFDGVLKGREGVFEGKKDFKNQVIVSEDFDEIKPRDGLDLTLTINRGIQEMVEEKLMYWMDRVKSKEATAVIMEPNTGRILALANFPTYDANQFWKGEYIDCRYEFYSVANEVCNPKPEGYIEPTPTSTPIISNDAKALTPTPFPTKVPNDPYTNQINAKINTHPAYTREIFRRTPITSSEIFTNAANSSLYEPGSVVKVMTLAVAYDTDSISRDPNYSLGNSSGCEKVIEEVLCNSGKIARNLTVESTLENSDNVGALRIALKVPTDQFIDRFEKLGLGKLAEPELYDEPAFKMKEPTEWTAVDVATASYGQGSIAFTPIQLAKAWNILASDGKSYKTTILREITDNGEPRDIKPEFIEQAISESAAKDALSVSSQAISKSGLPAVKSFYSKYPYAAKTGTADIPKAGGGYKLDVVNTSYLGSAPLVDPKFTMLVWFREPREGVDNTQPLAINTAQRAWLDIAENLMLKFNVAPQNTK